MDNKVVVGVGNIYANEALFATKISPEKITNTLTLAEITELVLQIKKVLQRSIEQGGTTLKDFYSRMVNRVTLPKNCLSMEKKVNPAQCVVRQSKALNRGNVAPSFVRNVKNSETLLFFIEFL